MADKEGVTIDRSGDRPVRIDNRSVLHQLRDALNEHLGQAPKHIVDGKGKTVDEVVNDAVAGAPAPDSPASDY